VSILKRLNMHFSLFDGAIAFIFAVGGYVAGAIAERKYHSGPVQDAYDALKHDYDVLKARFDKKKLPSA